MDYISILNYIITFILSLYGNDSLPRKIVSEVIDFFNNFLQDIYIPALKNDIITILKNNKIEGECLKNIEDCFKRNSKIFEYVDTELKRFSILKKKGLIDYKEFEIGVKFTNKLIDNGTKLAPETMMGVYVPLAESLKVFLEIPGIFDQIYEYSKQLSTESCIITNITQSVLWLEKYAGKFINDIVFPLFLFLTI